MNHQLHAAAFIKKAFRDHGILRRHGAQYGPALQDVFHNLFRSRIVEPGDAPPVLAQALDRPSTALGDPRPRHELLRHRRNTCFIGFGKRSMQAKCRLVHRSS